MVNITNSPALASAPSVSVLPDTLVGFQHDTSQYTYASPAGTTNDVVGGFPRFVGNIRLAVTLAGGNAIWTGLAAGLDGQHLVLWNTDASSSLTLLVANAGSLTPNQFNGSAGTYVLSPGTAYELVYYSGLINAWVVIQGSNTGGGTPSVGGAVSVTVSASSTNNFNPGGGFPVGIGRILLNLSGADKDFTGLVAGVDGQSVTIFNVDTTGTANFLLANTGSSAANRFVGSDPAALPPGGQDTFIYNSSPTAGWYVG